MSVLASSPGSGRGIMEIFSFYYDNYDSIAWRNRFLCFPPDMDPRSRTAGWLRWKVTGHDFPHLSPNKNTGVALC